MWIIRLKNVTENLLPLRYSLQRAETDTLSEE